MKRVFIAYGFSEGPKIASKFLLALSQSNYKVSKDASEADIVITHSGGVFTVPIETSGHNWLIVGPTYWEGKSLLRSFTENVQQGYMSRSTLLKWLNKMMWHGWYIASKPVFTYRMWKKWTQKHDWYEKLWNSDKQYTVVRNINDPFCSPSISQIKNRNVSFAELPGYHDDMWTNPKPYMDLIDEL